MTAERDSMTLNEVSVPALGVEERSDEAPRAGRARSLRNISERECGELLDRECFGRKYLKALSMFGDVGEREKQRYWDRELRNEIAHLAIEAYRREEISRGRVLELSKTLRIAGDTLLNLAEAARGE